MNQLVSFAPAGDYRGRFKRESRELTRRSPALADAELSTGPLWVAVQPNGNRRSGDSFRMFSTESLIRSHAAPDVVATLIVIFS